MLIPIVKNNLRQGLNSKHLTQAAYDSLIDKLGLT
jgi:hypothetical protein